MRVTKENEQFGETLDKDVSDGTPAILGAPPAHGRSFPSGKPRRWA